jgi:hypothetical protein
MGSLFQRMSSLILSKLAHGFTVSAHESTNFLAQKWRMAFTVSAHESTNFLAQKWRMGFTVSAHEFTNFLALAQNRRMSSQFPCTGHSTGAWVVHCFLVFLARWHKIGAGEELATLWLTLSLFLAHEWPWLSCVCSLNIGRWQTIDLCSTVSVP